MSAKPVILVLGAGPRIGRSVAQKFATRGYNVVVASRKGTNSKTADGFLSLSADFSKPDSISSVFEAVKKEYNTAPSVVVYNAAALTPPSDQDSVLSVPAASLVADFNINTISPYVAAQEAIKGWETLPKQVKKTFIYTGNIQNVAVLPVPIMLTLGMGKAASAQWVGIADTLYKEKGYRFFYADERQPDGQLKGMKLDGPAHGDFFAQLVEHEGNIPWDATFVKDKGFVKFQ